MLRLKLPALIINLLALFLLTGATTLAQTPNTTTPPPSFVPGEVIVKFSDELTGQEAVELEGQEVESLPELGVVRVKVTEGQEQAAAARIAAQNGVAYAEPNYLAYTMDWPDDTSYTTQWGLSNVEFSTMVNFTTGSSDLVIAVVDTGIDLDHPDLDCTVEGGLDKMMGGWNFVSDNSTPDDDNSHGSHVAGIAAACTNNNTGITGMAPNARLLPVKVLSSSGSGSYADVAAGVRYAADQGAQIINLSLGGTGNSDLLHEAVQYAYNRGALVVAAAGNFGSSGNPVVYPGAYAETMAVGATTSSDGWASFSEYHDYVDISAPGQYIYSTWSYGGYGNKSGTSMATPFVAGLAAMVWSMDTSQTAAQVQQIIESTADDLGISGIPDGKDVYFGYGRINAGQALLSFYTLNLSTGGETISFTVGNDDTPDSTISYTVDDQTTSLPLETYIQVNTNSPDVISWTATLSPTVSWLEIADPTSLLGQASATESGEILLRATRPENYGKYSTTLIVSGETKDGFQLAPVVSPISIKYVPQLYRFYFPLIFGP